MNSTQGSTAQHCHKSGEGFYAGGYSPISPCGWQAHKCHAADHEPTRYFPACAQGIIRPTMNCWRRICHICTRARSRAACGARLHAAGSSPGRRRLCADRAASTRSGPRGPAVAAGRVRCRVGDDCSATRGDCPVEEVQKASSPCIASRCGCSSYACIANMHAIEARPRMSLRCAILACRRRERHICLAALLAISAQHLLSCVLFIPFLRTGAAKQPLPRAPRRAWPRADQRSGPIVSDQRRANGVTLADCRRPPSARAATGLNPSPDAPLHHGAAHKIEQPVEAPEQAEFAPAPAARNTAGADTNDVQPATDSAHQAGDQGHGPALPPAPAPTDAVEDKQPAPVSSGSSEITTTVKPPPSESAPSSPRIAACGAGPSTLGSQATPAPHVSPKQPPYDGRGRNRFTPASQAPQHTPPAQHPPSAVDAEPDSDSRRPDAVSKADAAAAPVAMAATSSACSNSGVTAGDRGAQLSALLPAERHKPGLTVLTSIQSSDWPQSPSPHPPPVVQPGSTGTAVPAALQPQPGMATPLAAGTLGGSELAAVPGACQPHLEDGSRMAPSAVEHQPAEISTPEDKVEGPPAVQRDSCGLEGVPSCSADLMRPLPCVLHLSTMPLGATPACAFSNAHIIWS